MEHNKMNNPTNCKESPLQLSRRCRLIATGSASFAGPFANNHPRRAEVCIATAT